MTNKNWINYMLIYKSEPVILNTHNMNSYPTVYII